MCNATMMGIMGRIAGYTGKQVTWDRHLIRNKISFPKTNWETGKHTPPLRPFPAPRTLLRRMHWAVVGYQNHIKIVLEVNLY